MVIATVNATQEGNDTSFEMLIGKCGLIDLFMTCADYPRQSKQRIVGGDNAKIGEFPWQVKLALKSSGELICGGTLLCEKFVLTAAHCITYAGSAEPLDHGSVNIILGDHSQNVKNPGEVTHEVKKWIVHPSYMPDPKYYNDIAIIELKEPAKINKFVNTACLPYFEPNDKSTVIISGWGKTQHDIGRPSKILQKAAVNIVSRKQCKKMYAKPFHGQTGEITKRMICAASKGKDSCQGDSGGNV